MSDQISNEIKKERARRLIEIDKDLEIKYHEKFLNKELVVLVEENVDGKAIGHTENFIKVEIPEKLEENTNYQVKVVKTYSDYVDGKLKK